MGIYQKDECRLAMMTARRHSPLHNNKPELIDYFVSPWDQQINLLKNLIFQAFFAKKPKVMP